MKKQYTREELAKLVEVTIDGTGIDPTKTFIDRVIPDVILHQYDYKDVLLVACDNDFRLLKCPSCYLVKEATSYKANGEWVKVNEDDELYSKVNSHNKFGDGKCPDCETRSRENLKSGRVSHV